CRMTGIVLPDALGVHPVATTRLSGVAQVFPHEGTAADPIVVGMQRMVAQTTAYVPGPTHSAAGGYYGWMTRGRSANTGTSSGWETRCGMVGSSDISSRRAREERCRLLAKNPAPSSHGPTPAV